LKEFATPNIRNVALVAHHGVGKTSLAEAMLFLAKATSRLTEITGDFARTRRRMKSRGR
jgi:elongation factor G